MSRGPRAIEIKNAKEANSIKEIRKRLNSIESRIEALEKVVINLEVSDASKAYAVCPQGEGAEQIEAEIEASEPLRSLSKVNRTKGKTSQKG